MILSPSVKRPCLARGLSLPSAAWPEEQAAAAIGKVFNHFRTMHRRFHAWREGELAAVNRAIAAAELPINISAPMSDMLALSADYGARSEHLFNPAIGRLVALWGFTPMSCPTNRPLREKLALLSLTRRLSKT